MIHATLDFTEEVAILIHATSAQHWVHSHRRGSELDFTKAAAMTQPNLFNTGFTSVHRRGRHAVSRDCHEAFVIVLLTFRTNSTTQNTITSVHIPRLYA